MNGSIRTLAAIGCLTLCLCARADLPVPPESSARAELSGMSFSDDPTNDHWGPTGKEDGEVAAEAPGTADASVVAGEGGERMPISLTVGLMLTWFWMMASGVFVLLFLGGLVRTWIRRRKGAKK